MSYAEQFQSTTGDDGLLLYLTCCNDKVYALAILENSIIRHVLQLDIMVKDKEVVISLMPFLECPYPSFHLQDQSGFFLKGSCTELFLVIVMRTVVTISRITAVHLFKLNMTSMMWEETEELSDALFFVDLDPEYSVFYRSTIASELGGYIHIRGNSGKLIYSYQIKDKTISPSSTSCLVQRSRVSMWEIPKFRLEGDTGVGNSNSKQEDTDDEMVVKEVEYNNTMNDSHMLNVPLHVLEMIMELCVGVEYMKFRATCKRCHLAAPLIKWRNEAALRRMQNYSFVSPWLMVVDEVRSIITFTDPMFGDKYYTRTLNVSIYEDVIYCSRFGWLLFFSELRHMVFFNPFTNDIRKLPYAPCRFESSCFSAPPTSPSCMVVGLNTHNEVECVHILFLAHDTFWRTVDIDFGVGDPYYFRCPAFYDLDLYALCNNDGKIDVFNLKESGEDFSWTNVVNEAPRSCCTSDRQYFLVKSDEHHLLVIVGEIGESVEVFRLNDSTEKWEKIDDLGWHMIYICETTCLCIEAKMPEMANKIYFPRLHSKNGKVVFYSLETCRYHTFDGKNVQGNFTDFSLTKLHLLPHAWIEPSWS